MTSEKFAKILSIVLGPLFWFPILILTTVFNVGLERDQINILLPSLLLLQLVVPAIYIYLALKFKKASAWDLPNRQERYPFIIVVLISYFLSIILTHNFGNTLLFNLNLIIFALTAIMFFTTLFWKISFHTGLNTGGSILINFLFDGKFPLIFLTIPVVFWARYKLKRHSFAQLVAGIIFSGGFILLAFKYLGYI